MSDLLTHWAVFDDCRQLAQHDDQIEPLFCNLIATKSDSVGLGVVTRSRNRLRWLPSIIAHARDEWEHPAQRPRLERHVAFALGSLLRRACDRAVKPLMKQCAKTAKKADHPPPDPFRDVSAYYDSHIFRQVYMNGADGAFNRFLFADNQTSSGQALEAFIRALFQRTLLASHSIIPDDNDIEGWIDRLLDTVQPLSIDVQLFVDVFQRPEPAKMQQYGVETLFYRADDPAIQIARALQHGDRVTTDQVRNALADSANTSRYGQALGLGMAYLRDASTFWQRKSATLLTPDEPSS
ncbi:MAG: hypothetical protein MI924_39300 [Chloroflexales bacterium]|nr:hypothetical protein [Chloroflexales bacterium]